MKSSPFFASYAAVSSGVNLRDADPSGAGRCPERIRVGGSGTLVVRPRGTSGASDQTIHAVGGAPPFCVEAESILTGSTATNVSVIWGRNASGLPTEVATEGPTVDPNAYVRLTTTATATELTPMVEASSGTVTWTVEETEEVFTGLTPTITLPGTGVCHVRMRCSDGLGTITLFNIGFDVADDAGKLAVPGGTDHDLDPQPVTAVENAGLMTGLLYWMSANNANLASVIDLRGATGLIIFEAFHSGVTGVLHNSTALRRICIEGCSVSALDLRTCRTTIEDVRFGAQGYNIGQIGQITLTFALIERNQRYEALWHVCGNETRVANVPFGDQLPVLEDAWWWNGAQGVPYGTPGTYEFDSPNLIRIELYGDSSSRGNRYTSIDIGPTTALTTVRMQYNALQPVALDSLISQVRNCAVTNDIHNGVLNLGGYYAPTSDSDANVATLRAMGWTVTLSEGLLPGVDSDDFEGAGTLASRGWITLTNDNATAEVIEYGGQHAINMTYTAWSMRKYMNPGSGSGPSHGTNYSVTMYIVPEAFTTALWNHGLGIKCDPFGCGIAIKFASPTSYAFGIPTSFSDDSFPRTVLHSFPTSWTTGGAIRILKLSVYGDQCDLYAGAVGDAQLTHIFTANLSTVLTVNRDTPDTFWGFCGAGSNDDAPTRSHAYTEITTAAVTSAPPTND